MKKIYFVIFAALTLAACTGDLDQLPHTGTESVGGDVYSTPEGYKMALAKLYASYVIVGQEQGGGNADISSNNGHDFLRCLFNLQENATDEVACTWLSGDKVEGLTYMSWDANDPWVSDTYYRLYYTIALCNEFLRHAADGSISGFSSSGQSDIRAYRAEARFLRALAYSYVLDLFGKGPFVDETMGVGTYIPECYSNKQLFEYIEGELKAISEGGMPNRAAQEYGRAPEAAAWTLLAKLYLNAEVYGAGARYTDCIAYCKRVANAGYSLEPDYSKLFNADNHKRTNEIIFPFVVDAVNTVTWGATTFIVCGQCSDYGTQTASDYGVTAPWGMFRVRGELPALFGDAAASPDSRCKFYTDGQSQWFTKAIDDQTQGYFGEKYSNLADDGAASSNTGSSGADIDFPLMRLADVFLMQAEAVLRGGSGSSRPEAVGLINQLRQRAYGSEKGNIIDSQLTLDMILDERARELYWECCRRTDLVRFGKFAGGNYIWQWKGGVLDGRATDSKYNVYPIPAPELSANPNLTNENY